MYAHCQKVYWIYYLINDELLKNINIHFEFLRLASKICNLMNLLEQNGNIFEEHRILGKYVVHVNICHEIILSSGRP